MTRAIRLHGFDHRNLLAFLALLGVLKTLGVSRPEWNACASWIGVVPHLHVPQDANDEQVAEAVTEGLAKIGTTMKFRGEDQKPVKNLKMECEEFMNLQNNTSPEIAASLGSDGCICKKDGKVEYPPLCMMLGSGHQNFLERLEKATCLDPDRKAKSTDEIKDVLFGGWSCENETDIAFRWSPEEYRPHAYMSKDPSKVKITTTVGANRLAAVGFTAYWCVPTHNGLDVVACEKKNNSWNTFWSIWDKKLPLDSILMLMRHPDMKNIQKGHSHAIADLQKRGIESVISAEIFWDGKYRNVTWGRNVA